MVRRRYYKLRCIAARQRGAQIRMPRMNVITQILGIVPEYVEQSYVKFGLLPGCCDPAPDALRGDDEDQNGPVAVGVDP